MWSRGPELLPRSSSRRAARHRDRVRRPSLFHLRRSLAEGWWRRTGRPSEPQRCRRRWVAVGRCCRRVAPSSPPRRSAVGLRPTPSSLRPSAVRRLATTRSRARRRPAGCGVRPDPGGPSGPPVGGRAATRGSAAVGWSVGGRDVGDGASGSASVPGDRRAGKGDIVITPGRDVGRARAWLPLCGHGGSHPRRSAPGGGRTSDRAATRSRVDAVDATSATPSRGPDRPNGLQVRTRCRLTRRAAAARCAPARWPRSAPGSGRTCRAAP